MLSKYWNLIIDPQLKTGKKIDWMMNFRKYCPIRLGNMNKLMGNKVTWTPYGGAPLILAYNYNNIEHHYSLYCVICF